MRRGGKQSYGLKVMGMAIFAAMVFGVQASAGALLEPVHGREGMVVAGHPEAAEIGLEILRQGGNAMDATVATALALGVAEPYGSGLGGKCAILYYEAKSGIVFFIDGMDAAGSTFEVDKLAEMSSAERAEGGAGIGVPGLVAALEFGHQAWGSQAWGELVLPAADLSEKGFLMVPGMSTFFERRKDRIRSHGETARIYLPEGKVPATGSRVPNLDLAETLRRIAEEGAAGFYAGPVAEKMVSEISRQGGSLTLEDFMTYKARFGISIHADVKGTRIHAGGPPTTGGATALLSLKALETGDWDVSAGFRAPQNLDLWARTLRHVYPRIQAAIADAPSTPLAWQKMLEADALRELRKVVGKDAAAAGVVGADADAAGPADGWTTHFVVADRFGNVASVTQSLSHHFGSGVTAPGTGVVLNNSLKNFSFRDPSGVNYGAPGKRPRSTIAPVIGLRGGQPVFALGLPGGGRIPTTTLAVLVDHLIFENSLGDAIAGPRVHLVRSWSAEPDSHILELEGELTENAREALLGLGWELRMVTDTEFFGGMNAVEIEDDGTFTGWADFRRTNAAAGY
jgi:gamma-glutamyltranspeptidase/glutathione hydrolase